MGLHPPIRGAANNQDWSIRLCWLATEGAPSRYHATLLGRENRAGMGAPTKIPISAERIRELPGFRPIRQGVDGFGRHLSAEKVEGKLGKGGMVGPEDIRHRR